MYRSPLSLVAESVVIDSQTQLVSAFNIIGKIAAGGFPLALNKIGILFIITREPDDADTIDGNIKVTLAGTELVNQPIQIHFFDKTRANHVVTLQGLVITGPGHLKFSLHHNETEISATECEVVAMTAPTITTTPVIEAPPAPQAT